MTQRIGKNRNLLICLMASVIVLVISGLLRGELPYQYDASNYYMLAKSFEKDGSFSFLNMPENIRGYVFPFILYLALKLGALLHMQDWVTVLLLNSIVFSLVVVYFLPYVLECASYQNAADMIKRMIPVGLVALFWKDLVYFPLSDLYSYGFLVLAIYVLLRLKERRALPIRLLLAAVEGLLLYGMYNTRTIYLFVIPVILLVWLVFRIKEKFPWKRMVVLCLVMILAAGICAWPQYKINQQNFGKSTVAVITNDLFSQQLYWGITMQRYETYAGDGSIYPYPDMRFEDKEGVALLEKEGISGFESIGEFFRFFVRHPLEYLSVLGRHLVNALHLPFNEVYIRDLIKSSAFLEIANYTILFMFAMLLSFSWQRVKKRELFTEHRVQFLTTMITCVAILPGAIETRFFMPAYVAVYVAGTAMAVKGFGAFLWKHKGIFVILYIMLYVLFSAVWGNTMASLRDIPLQMIQ